MGAVKKYRYVQTDLWEKSWFRQLGYKEKYLYLYFLTCPSSNVAGILEITDARIKFDTGLTSVRSSMEKLKDSGEIYEIEGYIVVHRHPDFQKWEQKPNICKGIIAELECVPLEVFNEIQSRGYHFELLYNEQRMMVFIKSRNDKGQKYLPTMFIDRCNYREIGKAFETLSNPFNYSESYTDTEFESQSESQSESKRYISLTEMANSHEDDDFSDFLKLYEQLYSEEFEMEHKAITEEQAEKIRNKLKEYNIFDDDQLTQINKIQQFFKVPNSYDYSLLHFATDGILDILNKRLM